MIIDALVHIDEKWGWKHTAEAAIKMMNLAGIDKAFITSYFELPGEDPNALNRLLDAIKKYPNRFPGAFLRMNPSYGDEAVRFFEECAKKYKIKGLKFHPVSAPLWPNHPLTLALIRKAAELDLPTYFHGGTDPMSLPLQIGKAAKEVPDANIILGHWGGFYYGEDAITVAKKRKNVYLDTSISPFPRLIRKGIDILGPEKVVFSSDLPGIHAVVELKKLDFVGLSKYERERVCHLNMAEMTGLKGV